MDITETPRSVTAKRLTPPQYQRRVSVAAGDKFHVNENTFCWAQITAENTNLNEKSLLPRII